MMDSKPVAMRKTENLFYKIIAFLPAIVVMCLIFYFSSLDATNSSEESSRVVNAIIWLLKKLSILDLNSYETAQLAEKMTYPVRKIAHMTEYAVLAVALFWGFHNLVTKWCYSISWIVSVAYAISDEIHQLYVPGRAGKVTDVLIDGTGACLGLLCIYWIVCILSNKRQNNNRKGIKKHE